MEHIYAYFSAIKSQTWPITNKYIFMFKKKKTSKPSEKCHYNFSNHRRKPNLRYFFIYISIQCIYTFKQQFILQFNRRKWTVCNYYNIVTNCKQLETV